MELKVESHPNNKMDKKRLVAVPSNKSGFFIDLEKSNEGSMYAFEAVGIHGVTEEQINEFEQGKLSLLDLFEVTYLGEDHKIIISPDQPKLGAVAIRNYGTGPTYTDVKVFAEAQVVQDPLQ